MFNKNSEYSTVGDDVSYLKVTGWDRQIIFLLLHALIDLLWGIALAIFASGRVSYTWTVSQWGKQHAAITSVVLTLIATISTTHVKYIYQLIVDLYARAKLAEEFTLKQLQWMQGMKEWNIFTPFPFGYFLIWLLIYGAMALHSASIVAILQPVDLVQNVLFNDTIPCAVNATDLVFDVAPGSLSAGQQTAIDLAAVNIGQQWVNYYDAVGGNTTTAVMGRVYVKENLTYGAVGGLENGLQEIPGVEFNANCIDGTQLPTSAWSAAFPQQSVPTVSISKGNVSIESEESVSSSSMQSISTRTYARSANSVQTAFYGLVSTNGTGGIIVADSSGNVTTCIWTTSPFLVHVQMVGFVAQAVPSLPTEYSDQYPPYIGRGVLRTVQGIGNSIAMGARLSYTDSEDGLWDIPAAIPSLSNVLEVMLADGTKAFLTGLG